MAVSGFDHVAFPTTDGARLLDFYKALGFGTEHEEEWRRGEYPIFAITFGDNKINVHGEGFHTDLKGPTATPGCADLCFVWDGGVDALLARLDDLGVEVIEGPVGRIGGRAAGTAAGTSVYVRDPDQNLLEFISYDPTSQS